MSKVGKVNFEPAPGKVLIREKVTGKTATGVILQQEEGSVTATGSVFASSVDWIKPGDVVVYNKHAALGVNIPDGKYLLLADIAIIGKIPA